VEAIKAVLAELRSIVPFDSASVQELRGGKLVIVGGIGFEDVDVIIGESFDIHNADSPNGEVIYRKTPFRVADTEKYRAFRRGLHVGADIRSWLGVPIVEGDEILGMFALDKREPGFYTPEHERAAVLFAPRIADEMARLRSRNAS